MELIDVTFVGPPVTDPAALDDLPPEYRLVLEQVNGFVAFGGGLHVRGVCAEPEWHSLEAAWHGPQAVHRRYPPVNTTDVPFGQDAVGDQFFLRGDAVYRLAAETGEKELAAVDFAVFLEQAIADPVGTLGLQPLLKFRRDGGVMEPGQLLSVYPPFCTEEAAKGVSLKAISAADCLGSLADFAAQINGWPRPDA